MQNGRLITLLTILTLLTGCTQDIKPVGVIEGAEKGRTLNIEAVIVDAVKVPPELLEYEEWVSLGTYKLTAYCSCSKCCGKWASLRPNGKVYGASGVELKANHSIAVDTSVIPYGTVVKINGTEYVAEDCGGLVKGSHIDIYFDSHEEAVAFALQYAEVFILKEFN